VCVDSTVVDGCTNLKYWKVDKKKSTGRYIGSTGGRQVVWVWAGPCLLVRPKGRAGLVWAAAAKKRRRAEQRQPKELYPALHVQMYNLSQREVVSLGVVSNVFVCEQKTESQLHHLLILYL